MPMTVLDALKKAIDLDIKTVLDVGSGEGLHAAEFEKAGLEVTTNSLIPPADILGDFMDVKFGRKKFDLVWAAHVLEHNPNPNLFLKKCFSLINDGGYIAVTVPPLKHNIVGGHVNLYNAGVLLYQLILAGFDCSDAMVKSYGYNISVIVKKKVAVLPDDLEMDCGDIEKLAKFFPINMAQNFDGQIKVINWN